MVWSSLGQMFDCQERMMEVRIRPTSCLPQNGQDANWHTDSSHTFKTHQEQVVEDKVWPVALYEKKKKNHKDISQVFLLDSNKDKQKVKGCQNLRSRRVSEKSQQSFKFITATIPTSAVKNIWPQAFLIKYFPDQFIWKHHMDKSIGTHLLITD